MAVHIGKVAIRQHRGAGAGTIVITRPIDSISPQLRAAFLGKQLLPAVQGELLPAVQHELLPAVQHGLLPAVQHGLLLPAVQSPAFAGNTVLLRNVRVVNITPSWAGGAPQESVTFEYGALTVT